MLLPFLNKKIGGQPTVSTYQASGQRAPSEGAGVALAQSYRTGRPPRMLVRAYKHHVGWELLDQESRLSLQHALCALVERSGGHPITFPFREAIAVDFAVELATSSAFAQRRADLSRLPNVEDDLRDAERRARSAEERLRGAQQQLQAAQAERDEMLSERAAERDCNVRLANRLSSDWQELSARLLLPQEAPRRGKSVRYSLPPAVPGGLDGHAEAETSASGARPHAAN